MNYKKPAFWIICISLIVCVVVAVCFLTNPKQKNDVVGEEVSLIDEVSLNETDETGENGENVEVVDSWDYPIKDWTTAQSNGLDFMGWKDICNPSDDILKNLSTERLAYLAVRYPLFPYMPGGATDSESDVLLGVYAGYSSIFQELLTREDRNSCILKEFAQNELDVETYNSENYIENESIWIEIFVEQYLFMRRT